MSPYRSELETAHAKIARLEATVHQLTAERTQRDRARAPSAAPSSPWPSIAVVAASCATIVAVVSLAPHNPPARARSSVDGSSAVPPFRPSEPTYTEPPRPRAIAPSPEPQPPGGGHVVHSSEHGVIDDLLRDERAVVWAGDGTIRMLDLATNEVRTLASGIVGAPVIAMNRTHVYWAGWRAGTVMRVTREGGAPEVVADIGERLPTGIVLTPTHVYWTEFIGAVHRLPLEAGAITAEALADGSGRLARRVIEDLRWEASVVPASPEIRGDFLYVLATRGEVRRLRIGPDPAIAGTSAWETIAMLDGVHLLTEITLDDTHVYGSSINGSFVFRAPLEGGTPEILNDEQQPLGLALADGWLYMTTSRGVTRMPRGGGPIETIARGYTHGITVGGGRVYWASEDPTDLNRASIESMPVP